jgi:hypothetical protein
LKFNKLEGNDMDSTALKNKISSFLAFGLSKRYDHSAKALNKFEGSFIDILKYKWALNKKVNSFLKQLDKNYKIIKDKDYNKSYKSQIKKMFNNHIPTTITLELSNYEMQIKNFNKKLKIQNVVNVFCKENVPNNDKDCVLSTTDWIRNIVPKDLDPKTLYKYTHDILSENSPIEEVGIEEYNKIKNSENTFINYSNTNYSRFGARSESYWNDHCLKTGEKINLNVSGIKLYYDYLSKQFKLSIEINYISCPKTTIYRIKKVAIKKYIPEIKFFAQPALEDQIDLDKIEEPDFGKYSKIDNNVKGALEPEFCAYIDSIAETYNDPDPCGSARKRENDFWNNYTNEMEMGKKIEKVISLYDNPKAKKSKKKSKKEQFKIKANESFV